MELKEIIDLLNQTLSIKLLPDDSSWNIDISEYENEEIINHITNAVKMNSKLEELAVSSDNNSMLSKLAYALCNTSLKTLDLSNNEINSSVIMALASTLCNNSNLCHLNLSNENIHNINLMDLNCAGVFVALLDNNAHLLSLNLRHNSMYSSVKIPLLEYDESPIKALSIGLANNRVLHTLDLSYTMLSEEGVRIFANALKNNKSLSVLILENFTDEAEEVAPIFSLIEVINSMNLYQLDIRCNSISKHDIEFLSETIKTNKTIAVLILDECNIDDQGAKIIADIIKNNITIISLSLLYNKITIDGAQHLSKSLELNQHIIYLYCNKIFDKIFENKLYQNTKMVCDAYAIIKLYEESTITNPNDFMSLSKMIIQDHYDDQGQIIISKNLLQNFTSLLTLPQFYKHASLLSNSLKMIEQTLAETFLWRHGIVKDVTVSGSYLGSMPLEILTKIFEYLEERDVKHYVINIDSKKKKDVPKLHGYKRAIEEESTIYQEVKVAKIITQEQEQEQEQEQSEELELIIDQISIFTDNLSGIEQGESSDLWSNYFP